MAVRHRLIRKSPKDVWEVLSDVERYGDRIVGPSRAEPDESRWPEPGAALIILDEHPLRGTGGALHNSLLEVAQQMRNRAMLGCLARLCEGDDPPRFRAATAGLVSAPGPASPVTRSPSACP